MSFAFSAASNVAERVLLSRWLASLTALALAAVAIISTGGSILDRALFSLRDAALNHSASGEVHIIEIDAASLASIAKWPWPRTIHAQIVERLQQAGARSIAFDVDFSASSDQAGDAAFARALERAGGKVVLPTFRQQASARDERYIDALPIAPLRERAFLAIVNVSPDADGYVRRMPLGLKTGGVPRPSLAAMLAETNAQIDRSFDVDFSIDPATIPRHSVADLISGRAPASDLAGRRILIGATAVEMGDRYAVPGHGVIPGVVIQAMAAETLMQGPLPRRVSPLWAIALVVALVVSAASIAQRSRRIWAFAGGVLVLIALPIVALHWFAITLPVGAGLIGLTGAVVVRLVGWVVERFTERAHLDAETGLPNLAALERDAAELEELHIVTARIQALTMIAATIGPEATRMFVQRLAERLQFATGAATIYRIDDGVLAWIETSGSTEIAKQVERASESMSHPIECGRRVDASVAIGVASASGPTARQGVANALLAATKAEIEPGALAWFDAATGDEANRYIMLLGEVDEALRVGQIWNAYQPKLDIVTGQIVGAEALVRWDHPDHGMIRPDIFIPIVEKAGRIRDLTLHVLRTAQNDAYLWQQRHKPINVAVNVSARLLTDHLFIETVRRELQTHPLPPESLTIEMTESATMAEPDRAIAALESWRSLGVDISIDDYGTGQSSLNYLQKLPATELKIDRSFVASISHDVRNAAMVRSTIQLAHDLSMTVVAEGIEDQACLDALREMGCDKAQGYLIGKPMSFEDLSRMLMADSQLVAIGIRH